MASGSGSVQFPEIEIKRHIIDDQIFDRGVRIAKHREEPLSNLKCDTHILSGLCRGSEGSPYVINVAFSTDPLIIIDHSTCTCEYGRVDGRCKHVVALLLKWNYLQQLQARARPQQPTVPIKTEPVQAQRPHKMQSASSSSSSSSSSSASSSSSSSRAPFTLESSSSRALPSNRGYRPLDLLSSPTVSVSTAASSIPVLSPASLSRALVRAKINPEPTIGVSALVHNEPQVRQLPSTFLSAAANKKTKRKPSQKTADEDVNGEVPKKGKRSRRTDSTENQEGESAPKRTRQPRKKPVSVDIDGNETGIAVTTKRGKASRIIGDPDDPQPTQKKAKTTKRSRVHHDVNLDEFLDEDDLLSMAKEFVAPHSPKSPAAELPHANRFDESTHRSATANTSRPFDITLLEDEDANPVSGNQNEQSKAHILDTILFGDSDEESARSNPVPVQRSAQLTSAVESAPSHRTPLDAAAVPKRTLEIIQPLSNVNEDTTGITVTNGIDSASTVPTTRDKKATVSLRDRLKGFGVS